MHKVRALRIACLFFPIALACAHASQALVTTGSQEVREAIEARSREIYEKAGPWLFLLTAENLTGTVDAVGTELNGPLFNGRVARITPSAWITLLSLVAGRKQLVVGAGRGGGCSDLWPGDAHRSRLDCQRAAHGAFPLGDRKARAPTLLLQEGNVKRPTRNPVSAIRFARCVFTMGR